MGGSNLLALLHPYKRRGTMSSMLAGSGVLGHGASMIPHMEVFPKLAASFGLLERDDPPAAIAALEAALTPRRANAAGCRFSVGLDGPRSGKKRAAESRAKKRGVARAGGFALLSAGGTKGAQSKLGPACSITPELVEGCINVCRRLGVPCVCHPEENDAGIGHGCRSGSIYAAVMTGGGCFAHGITRVVAHSTHNNAWCDYFDISGPLPLGAGWKKSSDEAPGRRIIAAYKHVGYTVGGDLGQPCNRGSLDCLAVPPSHCHCRPLAPNPELPSADHDAAGVWGVCAPNA